jgi:GMP synthase (glutamine-hydrolysing)
LLRNGAGLTRVLVIQHEDGTGPGLIGERLEAAGADVDLRHPWQGDALPDDLSGHDALLVLGGTPAAFDDVAWWPAVLKLLRGAVADEVPVLGICLGAQLLAVACGGTVARAGHPQIGLYELSAHPAAAADELFGGLPPGPVAVQWHWDEITALPPGAVPLLYCPDFPNQAYRLGARAWGVQFHPEVGAAEASKWAASDTASLEGLGLDVQAMLGVVEEAEPELLAIWAAWADRWIAVAGSGP